MRQILQRKFFRFAKKLRNPHKSIQAKINRIKVTGGVTCKTNTEVKSLIPGKVKIY